MKKLYRYVGMILLVFGAIYAHGHEAPRIPVIVDTDVALDDVRALALLLQSDEIDLLAIVTSDGACVPERGAQNIRRVLHFLGKSNIPVAAGRDIGKPSPPWRPMSESLGWSEPMEVNTDFSDLIAEQLIARKINESNSSVVYVCLGPMTNISKVIATDSSLVENIGIVYYSGSVPDIENLSWNTARDLEAARVAFHSGLSIRAIELTGDNLLTFNSDLLSNIDNLNTSAAVMISQMHKNEKVRELIETEHMRCWDEMVVMSLLEPNLFTFRPWSNKKEVMVANDCDESATRLLYLNLLSGDRSVKPGHREAVILAQYPVDPALLREDIRSFAPTIIEKHGLAEWNTALITSEMHRHLGVYSLLGVKMGIRAREILDTGLDELHVISHAGSGPPLSCMTDGLQVATGASLGRGTIRVEPDKAEPEAVFIDGERHLTLRLKGEVIEKIKTDFNTAIEQYGLLTPAYWDAVRKLALQYWLGLDRKDIFTEEFTVSEF